MGKLIVTEFVTLDGVAQAPGARRRSRQRLRARRMAGAADGSRVRQRHVRACEEHGRLLLGRKTYEIFAGYWPTAPDEIPFTGLLNRVPKYVASRTLTGPLTWQGSTLVTGDFVERITAVKERHDEVHVIGSLDLVQSLLRFGLVDRLNLWLYPLLLGSGKQVFADGTVPTALRLTESVTHPNGTLQLSYETAGAPTYGNLAGDDAACWRGSGAAGRRNPGTAC